MITEVRGALRQRPRPACPLKFEEPLARALTKDGHRVSDFSFRRLMRELGYSLQANAKTTACGQHPDRTAPFGYLGEYALTTRTTQLRVTM